MTWPFSWPSRLTKYSRYMPGLHIEHAYKEFKFVYVIDPNVTDFITVEDFDHWCQVNFCYFFGDTVILLYGAFTPTNKALLLSFLDCRNLFNSNIMHASEKVSAIKKRQQQRLICGRKSSI